MECVKYKILGNIYDSIYHLLQVENILHFDQKDEMWHVLFVISPGVWLMYWILMNSFIYAVITTFSLLVISVYTKFWYLTRRNLIYIYNVRLIWVLLDSLGINVFEENCSIRIISIAYFQALNIWHLNVYGLEVNL